MNIAEAVIQARFAMKEAYVLVKEFVDISHKDSNNRNIIYNLQGVIAKMINDNVNAEDKFQPYNEPYYQGIYQPQPMQEPLKDDPKETTQLALDMDKAIEEGTEDVKEARKKIK